MSLALYSKLNKEQLVNLAKNIEQSSVGIKYSISLPNLDNKNKEDIMIELLNMEQKLYEKYNDDKQNIVYSLVESYKEVC